ncbi:hypothetical protein EJB05_21391, partial [Eragrostis curvula]
MGACATKSGDLKVKGKPPLVVEDAVAPQVAEVEKVKAEVVPAAAETDSADVSRRRSLSVLLKEEAEASDGEDGQEAEKVVTVDSAVASDEAGAPASLTEEAEAANAPQVAVEPSVTAEEQDTAEQLTDDPKAGKEEEKVVAGDGEAGQEEEKVVTAVASDEAGAPASLTEEAEVAKAPQQVPVEPSVTAEEQDTAEQLTDDPKAGQEPSSNGDAEAAAEEEKQVDPDSVQVAVAAPTPSAEESKAADGTSA